jgi:hypothetical protein
MNIKYFNKFSKKKIQFSDNNSKENSINQNSNLGIQKKEPKIISLLEFS